MADDKTTGGKTPKPAKGDGSVDKDKLKKCQYEDPKSKKKCKNEAIVHTKKQEHLCAEHYRLIYDTEHAAQGKQKRNKLGFIRVKVGMIFPKKD